MAAHSIMVATIITNSSVSALSNIGLLRVLQLSSASLPVGGYSFSQGLEYAIDHGWLKNESDVENWIQFVMSESLSQVDLPLLLRLVDAIKTQDAKAFYYWNAYTLACRETQELRLTDTAMGDALVRLLNSLSIALPKELSKELPKKPAEALSTNNKKTSLSFVSAFAVAAVHWKIEPSAIQVGFLWAWLESQVAAATKLVPLGQTSAQRLLVSIGDTLDQVISSAEQISDDDIGSSLPGLAMASSWHETQYSRLFRS